MELVVDDWIYLAEGNANVVLAHNSLPIVLRLLKSSNSTFHPHFHLFISYCTLHYSYTLKNSIIHPSIDFLDKIKNTIILNRPSHRSLSSLHLLPNHATILPNALSSNGISIEIKPKWGFCPDHYNNHCRFCRHSVLRARHSSYSTKYCPMLLFSNNLSNISLAIQNLIQTPSNNLKVFVNQSQIENPSLMDSIWSLSDSLSFVDTLALVLYSNSLLDRLKLAQKVFHVDIFRIDALVKSLDTDIPTLDNLLFDHIHNSCQNGLFNSPFLHRSADYLLPEDLSVGSFDLDSFGQNDTLNLLLKAQNTIPNLDVNSQCTALDLPVNNPETYLDLHSKTQSTNLDMSELNQFSVKDFNNTNAAVNKTKNNYNQDEVEVDNVDPKISMESSHIGNTNSSHNNRNADTSHTNKQNVNNETLTEISKFIISQSLKDLSIIITLSTTIPPNHQQYIRTPIHPPTISQITPHSGIIQTNPPIFYELKVIDVDFKSMSKIQKWVDLELELSECVDGTKQCYASQVIP